MRYLLLAVLLLAMASSATAVPSSTAMGNMGARLVATQNSDGGWGWPLTGASAANTIGPIGMGLCKAYRATGNAAQLTALGKVSTYLLTKNGNFSPSDGYLAAELDSILGGTANVDYVRANLYDKLATNTYYRSTDPVGPFDTAGYVERIRTGRSGTQANLAAWDVGMGLVGAASCGVSGSELNTWIAGVQDEINELNPLGYYDVIGLAGGIYGLAFVGADFDPIGAHGAASNLLDLAGILANYQIWPSGGFAWNSAWVIPNDGNETIQETAYAILALKEVGGYDAEIISAADYIKSVQLGTGGWENYPTSGENNEISAEGGWGVSAAANTLSLVPTAASIYIKPGETVVVDMNVSDLAQPVNACQAMLGYASSVFADPIGGAVQAPGSGPWDDVIWDSWTDTTGVAGEIDTAIGVKAAGVSTTADGTVAKITLTANTGIPDCATKVVFRADQDPDPGLTKSTFLSATGATEVWPTKLDSIDIIVDSTKPVITCPADYSTSVATQSIAASVIDPVSGGVSSGVASFTMNAIPFTSPTAVVLVPGANVFTFEAVDNAGNVETKTLTITYTQPAPAINVYRSLAPNKYGSPTNWPLWLANAVTGARDMTSPVGATEYDTFADFGETDQDYSSIMVTPFGSWKGLLFAGECGTGIHFVWRLDNGVKTNPGAAKLDVRNISIDLKDIWVTADGTPTEDITDYSSWWNSVASSACFGGTSGFLSGLKGFNWNGSAWVEVTSGTQADLIVYGWFRYALQPENMSAPATQDTLNLMYKQIAGSIPYTGDPRETLDRQELEVKFTQAGVVNGSSGTVTLDYDSADATAPVISVTAPVDASKTNNPSCTITGSATDNETLASGIREVKITLNGGQVYLNNTQDNVSFAQAVTLAEGDNTIVVTAKDFAGNTSTQTVHVLLDTAPPLISVDSALEGTTNVLDGVNTTLQGTVVITVSASDASAGLNGVPAVTLTNGSNTAVLTTTDTASPFHYSWVVDSATADGTWTISASVSDLAGNSASDANNWLVVNKDQITGSIELQGFVGGVRTVTFVANGSLKTWTVPVTFTGTTGTYVLTGVPAGVTVSTLSAKTAWSLRRNIVPTNSGNGQFVADFTGAAKLLGGDINGTNSINVLDYSLMKTNWGAGLVGDIDGNGFTGSSDYDIMKANWFKVGDAQ